MFAVDYLISESELVGNHEEENHAEYNNFFTAKSIIKLILNISTFFINSFIFTPVSILFWTSTWDIIYIYLFQEQAGLSYAVSFLIAQIILLISYLVQYRVQEFGDKLKSSASKTGILSFYNKYFLFKTFYSYVLTIGYLAQWRTYWDGLNDLTPDVNYWYFFGLSIFAILFYRYLLGRKISSFRKTLPFQLTPDNQFEFFFLQGVFITAKNVNYFLNIFTLI